MVQDFVKTNTLNDKEALKEFLLDIDCLNSLKPWISKVNIFDVLKVSRTEIRHSNMLSWLLDANENHGLSDNFIKSLLQIVVKNNMEYFESKKINVLELLTLDFSNFVIFREWNNIDILLVSKEDKLVICIENKIGSAEHDNQLERYQEKVETTYQKSEGYDAIYIFLTPDKYEASDVDNWISFCYVDILDVLNNIIATNELDLRVKLIIENYIETLRRVVVKDKELEEICVGIYRKHKQALDLIFDNRPDSGNVVSDIIKEYLQARASESHDIIFDPSYSTKTLQRFSLASFDKILPPVPNATGGWGNGINYFWEIRNNYIIGNIGIKFVVHNYDMLNGGKAAKLSQLLNKDLKENWQWKTFESIIFSYTTKNQIEEFLDGDYDDIKKTLFSKLDKAMEKVSSFEKEVVSLWYKD
jgi:hypothetical protein